MVLKIDKENERFSLGVKQLKPDPWQTVFTNYPLGSTVDGTITNVTDFGIFVQLEEGIEGLVHVSEISRDKVKTPVGLYNIGDTLKTVVINVSSEDRKIGLSLKDSDVRSDSSSKGGEAAGSADDAAQKAQKGSGPATFGDLLKAAASAAE